MADDYRYNAISKWEKWCDENPEPARSSILSSDQMGSLWAIEKLFQKLERLFQKQELSDWRRARILGTIVLLTEDFPDNPFDGFEILFPWCHNCGELNILEEGITFRDEKICGDCSSIACEHCKKTNYELGIVTSEISDCAACSRPLCPECKIVCDVCEEEYCPDCIDMANVKTKCLVC